MMKILELTDDLIEIFIENTPIAYVLLDKDRRIHYINKSFLKLRHLDLKTTLGKHCYDISNHGVPCLQCAVEKSIKTKKPCFLCRCDKLPDGSVKYIDDYAIPLHNISTSDNEYILEIMINRTEEMNMRDQYNRAFEEIISIMSELLESKDTYTEMHSRNVETISYHIARKMNLSEEEIFNIALAARLHDIGKVGIPNAIITKPTRLTDKEFDIIKSHPVKSYEIIKKLESLKKMAEIVKHHHERLDGKGYPDGLKEDEISVGARIVAIADTFEAMTSDRSYRKALSPETALQEMKRVSGTQLDGDIVKIFESLHFNYDTYQPYTNKNIVNDNMKTVNRIITKSQLTSSNEKELKKELKHLDKNKILKEIFKNTPCGYLLMKPDYTVVYASPYFLEYMEVSEENVIGQKCYLNGSDGSKCKVCAVDISIKNNKPYQLRRHHRTNGTLKIFDMYGIPLKNRNDELEYIIEAIIDRTEEVNMENARINDFKNLFHILSDLIKVKSIDEGDEKMLEKIPELQRKLENLF